MIGDRNLEVGHREQTPNEVGNFDFNLRFDGGMKEKVGLYVYKIWKNGQELD